MGDSRAVLLPALLSWAFVPQLPAIELTPIANILADPGAYHLHSVALRGRVGQVSIILAHGPPSEVCFETSIYRFVLEDQTGFLTVGVHDMCGDVISEGEKVLVQAHVLVSRSGLGPPSFEVVADGIFPVRD